jgi:pyruvate/2-oxoglutarate dehydrogenase complex dihydrolipoamide dehydrogenase (E3) component
LLAAARAAAAVRDAGRFGIQVPAGVRVDFPAVMARLRRLRAELAVNDSAQRFRGLGVDVFLGQGRFVGPRAIEVSGQRLDFARAVIATGARAARPDIPGLESAGYLTNETIFSITQLPPRLAVIGAGPIGCELAQAFARLGSRVTLLANHERILPHEDARATAFVEQSLRRDGIELVLRCQVQRAQRQGMETILSVVSAGQARLVRADAVLVGVGRTPNVEGLNLEAASVEYDRHNGVKVDDRLRTTNPRVSRPGTSARDSSSPTPPTPWPGS